MLFNFDDEKITQHRKDPLLSNSPLPPPLQQRESDIVVEIYIWPTFSAKSKENGLDTEKMLFGS